jgi:glycosyltransferase involved in cell wall biosynthesis
MPPHIEHAGSRLNVLYVTANPFLRSTTSSLNAIIRELMPRGVRPVMLFTEAGPWQQSLQHEGVACHVRQLFVPDRRKPLQSALRTWELVRLMRRERIDLIHCNEHELYPACRIAAKLAGIPIVTSLHWTLEPGFGHWAFGRPYMPDALQFLSRGQLQLSQGGIPADLPADRVKLLMSGLFIDQFLQRGGDGRDLRRSWGVSNDTVVIGTATAIQRRKRLEDFIRVIAGLNASGRRVLGVIAGGGLYEDLTYRKELDELVVRENVVRRCRFIGNMDPVTPFFRAIDIAVNTSEMEILSMSMCEAMACAVPTIAYDVGGNAETVHDAWCAVPFGSVDMLRERAARLVDDADFRLQMGRAAEQHVRTHFDAPVLARRQAAIYEEILGRKAVSAERRTPLYADGMKA